MTDERAARLVDAVRQGWHGLGGGDAASCPGCPVCTLGEQVARLDPATTGHLQAAAAHLAAAGRELLAALGTRGTGPTGPTGPDRQVPPRAADEPGADADGAPTPTWTRIPVSTRPTDEEHQ